LDNDTLKKKFVGGVGSTMPSFRIPTLKLALTCPAANALETSERAQISG